MSTRRKRPADDAAEAAVGDLAGIALFTEMLSRIDDETDRILIFAGVGLEISNRNLSLALNVSTVELTYRIKQILSVLREDQEMAAKLHDFRRAGRVANYLALAHRLGLRDWFCAQCGQFMVPSERGRRRKTCSDRCRLRHFRGHRPVTADPASPSAAIAPAAIPDEMMSRLVRPIDRAERPEHFVRNALRWWQPETRLRDRAIVLLGLSCPVGLTSADIASLDVDDVVRTGKGIEVRLYRGIARPTRYATIHASGREVCPAAAVLAWARHLAAAGLHSGALFPRIDAKGKLIPVRLTDRAVARTIEVAANVAFELTEPVRLAASTPVQPFVYEIESQVSPTSPWVRGR